MKISLKTVLVASFLLGSTLAVVPLAYSKAQQPTDMNGMSGQHKSQTMNIAAMQDQMQSMTMAQDMMTNMQSMLGDKMPVALNIKNHQKMMGNYMGMLEKQAMQVD